MKRIFLFPGQGSQFVGMGRDLFDALPEARARADQARAVLGFDIRLIMRDGPEDELIRTANTQPALFLIATVLCEALAARGVVPDAVAGHSLGEYAALFAAGVFDFETGLSLVAARGAYIQQASEEHPGGMAALMGGDAAAASRLCAQAAEGEVLEPVNFNAPDQIVIAGTAAAIQRAVQCARSCGIKRAVELKVSGPFHSSLMESAAQQFAARLARERFAAPRIPVVMNVTARPETDPETIRKLLADQIRRPVRWQESITALQEDGAQIFCEVGPGRVLAGLNRRILPGFATLQLDTLEAIDAAARESAAGQHRQ